MRWLLSRVLVICFKVNLVVFNLYFVLSRHQSRKNELFERLVTTWLYILKSSQYQRFHSNCQSNCHESHCTICVILKNKMLKLCWSFSLSSNKGRKGLWKTFHLSIQEKDLENFLKGKNLPFFVKRDLLRGIQGLEKLYIRSIKKAPFLKLTCVLFKKFAKYNSYHVSILSNFKVQSLLDICQ